MVWHSDTLNCEIAISLNSKYLIKKIELQEMNYIILEEEFEHKNYAKESNCIKHNVIYS